MVIRVLVEKNVEVVWILTIFKLRYTFYQSGNGTPHIVGISGIIQ